MTLRYTVKVPMQVAGHDDAAVVRLLEATLTAAEVHPPATARPSLSRPVNDRGGETTAYLEVHARDKEQLESSLDTMLTALSRHRIVNTGPFTILAIRTDA